MIMCIGNYMKDKNIDRQITLIRQNKLNPSLNSQ